MVSARTGNNRVPTPQGQTVLDPPQISAEFWQNSPMNSSTRAISRSLSSLVFALAVASAGGASSSFFSYARLPLPYEADGLLRSSPAVPLQPHEILVEGYVLTRSGRAIEGVVVYPGAMNQLAEAVPATVAVTDSNGFFSIVVDRDRYTHLAAGCLLLNRRQDREESAVALGLITLPRAEVSQAERTFRLDLPKPVRRCAWPIEGPPAGTSFPGTSFPQ